jgi:hypothetical protein
MSGLEPQLVLQQHERFLHGPGDPGPACRSPLCRRPATCPEPRVASAGHRGVLAASMMISRQCAAASCA